MSFQIKNCSVFDVDVEAYCNTINVVGVMGAGIAAVFKTRYPEMFKAYQDECAVYGIKPGDCWTYKDTTSGKYLLNLAVKRDWREWATQDWISQSVKSLKLEILERDIKSIALPVLGGKNGRRGPKGPVAGMAQPLEREQMKEWLTSELTRFANRFSLDVYLCVPDETPTPTKRLKIVSSEFFNLK